MDRSVILAYTTYYARVLDTSHATPGSTIGPKLNLPPNPNVAATVSAMCLDIAHLVHADETIGVVFRMSEVSVTVAQDEISSAIASPRSCLEALVGEPLLHFMFIGIALFATYAYMNRGRGGVRVFPTD